MAAPRRFTARHRSGLCTPSWPCALGSRWTVMSVAEPVIPPTRIRRGTEQGCADPIHAGHPPNLYDGRLEASIPDHRRGFRRFPGSQVGCGTERSNSVTLFIDRPGCVQAARSATGSVASIPRRLQWVRFTSDRRLRPKFGGLQFSATSGLPQAIGYCATLLHDFRDHRLEAADQTNNRRTSRGQQESAPEDGRWSVVCRSLLAVLVVSAGPPCARAARGKGEL